MADKTSWWILLLHTALVLLSIVVAWHRSSGAAVPHMSSDVYFQNFFPDTLFLIDMISKSDRIVL